MGVLSQTDHRCRNGGACSLRRRRSSRCAWARAHLRGQYLMPLVRFCPYSARPRWRTKPDGDLSAGLAGEGSRADVLQAASVVGPPEQQRPWCGQGAGDRSDDSLVRLTDLLAKRQYAIHALFAQRSAADGGQSPPYRRCGSYWRAFPGPVR